MNNVIDATAQTALDGLATSSLSNLQDFAFSLVNFLIGMVTANLGIVVGIAVLSILIAFGYKAVKGRMSVRSIK